mmetsp:Transcript_5582/g.13290  ORF Transcript_5582/g.13290 Transcript_5582/m.13290 type:complete len:208 (-) Transcript_5582:462-1085(-)
MLTTRRCRRYHTNAKQHECGFAVRSFDIGSCVKRHERPRGRAIHPCIIPYNTHQKHMGEATRLPPRLATDLTAWLTQHTHQLSPQRPPTLPLYLGRFLGALAPLKLLLLFLLPVGPRSLPIGGCRATHLSDQLDELALVLRAVHIHTILCQLGCPASCRTATGTALAFLLLCVCLRLFVVDGGECDGVAAHEHGGGGGGGGGQCAFA